MEIAARAANALQRSAMPRSAALLRQLTDVQHYDFGQTCSLDEAKVTAGVAGADEGQPEPIFIALRSELARQDLTSAS
jgi:hypothetical protein